MKRLIILLSLCLFCIIGCQDNSRPKQKDNMSQCVFKDDALVILETKSDPEHQINHNNFTIQMNSKNIKSKYDVDINNYSLATINISINNKPVVTNYDQEYHSDETDSWGDYAFGIVKCDKRDFNKKDKFIIEIIFSPENIIKINGDSVSYPL